MRLNAGQLNSRVTLRSRVGSVDTEGQPSDTWADTATVWANVRAPSGSSAADGINADAMGSTTAYSVRIRRRTDITTGMRAVVDGAVCVIAQVIQDVAGREYTDLVCVAGEVQ